jgi:inhibitor of KinA
MGSRKIVHVEPINETSVIIQAEAELSRATSQLLHYLAKCLLRVAGIVDVTLGYVSVLVSFDVFQCDEHRIQQWVADFLADYNPDALEVKRVTVPVYYDVEVGLDLLQVAHQVDCAVGDVIHYHHTPVYYVYAMGFLPGFGYLGTLDSILRVPRQSTPRSCVPAGSVAIAGAQTAIYPKDSPGGWWILGKTPLPLPEFHAGDEVCFVPISRQQFIQAGGVI